MTPDPDPLSEPGAVLIHPADPKLRRRLILLLLVLAAGGIALILGLDAYLERIVEASKEEPERAMRHVFNLLRLCMTLGGAGSIVFGLYFGNFSLKVISEARFPPTGTRLVRDTPIRLGAAARLRGRIGLLFSGLLIIAGLLLPWLPDLLIRPLMIKAEREAPAEPAAPAPSAPSGSKPELHARFAPRPQPGRGEIGPGPSSSSRRLSSG